MYDLKFVQFSNVTLKGDNRIVAFFDVVVNNAFWLSRVTLVHENDGLYHIQLPGECMKCDYKFKAFSFVIKDDVPTAESMELLSEITQAAAAFYEEHVLPTKHTHKAGKSADHEMLSFNPELKFWIE